METCEIVSPLLLKTLLALRSALAAGELPRGLREIEAFVNASDSQLLLTATFAGFPSRAAEHAATFRRIAPEITSLLFHDPSRDRMELYGPGYIEYEAAGNAYRVGHFSFFQVNKFLAETLVRVAVGSETGGDPGHGIERTGPRGDRSAYRRCGSFYGAEQGAARPGRTGSAASWHEP